MLQTLMQSRALVFIVEISISWGPVWLVFLHLFTILFHFKKDPNPFGPNPFSTPFWSFLKMVSTSNLVWAVCHSALLISSKPFVIFLARMPIQTPLGRLICVLLISFLYLLQTLSFSTQILLWPPLISVSNPSATVFTFSFSPNLLSDCSVLLDLPVRTIQGNLLSYLFFCLLS